MTFEDKAKVVIAQLRADRDRLDKALNDIKTEIETSPKTYPFVNPFTYHFDAYIKEDDVMKIIDKHMAEGSEK